MFCFSRNSISKKEIRIVILPTEARIHALRMHDSKIGCHLGTERLKDLFKQRFYGQSMTADIKNYVRSCDICQRSKNPNPMPCHTLGNMTESTPFFKVAVDITGPFVVSTQGNRYILAIQDYAIKWLELVPLPDILSETVAQAFVTNFVCRFGVPQIIVSDSGVQFMAKLFKDMCALLHTNLQYTPPQCHQANGFIERSHRTVLQLLKCNLQNDVDWDKELIYIAHAYRISNHITTELTPFEALFNHKCRIPLDLITYDQDNNNEPVTFSSSLREKYLRNSQLIKSNL